VDLRKAAASQKSSRNKMCIIIIVLALVLGALVIGGVLLGTLGPWSKD
jgi:flagellar basal body-associated protein FliL